MGSGVSFFEPFTISENDFLPSSFYVISSFPLPNVGRLFGVLNLVSFFFGRLVFLFCFLLFGFYECFGKQTTGIFSLLQYAGIAVAVRSSWFVPLGVFTAFGVATIFCPIKLAMTSKRKARIESKELVQ